MSFTKIAAAGIGSTETVTLHSLEVLNNATIGGVLTYEDVTNVDSIGIITARAGVLVGSGITLSKDGDIFATGVTTATSFVGALTGNVTGNISGGTVAGSTGTFTGDVDIADKIVHTGDTNTAIRFPAADTVSVETGGAERLNISSSATIFNDAGADIDFRIESDTKGTMFFLDAGNNRIGINNGSPTCMLDITGADTSGDGIIELLKISGTGNNNNDGVKLTFARVGNESCSITAKKVLDNNTTDLIFNTRSGNTVSESLRIDGSGRLLVGTDTARAVGGESNPVLHIEGAGNTSNSWINLTRFQAGTGSANLQFAKSRSNTPGTYTVVQADDKLGQISFLGSDGTDMANYAAKIESFVDGTPGSNDMPGRLVFSTTPDGNSSPSTRMTISANGSTHFGNGGLNDANVVSIIPSDGRISFGMDGRTSLVTGESGAYIFSGQGASGSILAGELVLQSRSNVNRDMHFATGATPTMRARFRGSDGDFFLGNDLATITTIGTAFRENDTGGETYMEMGHSGTGANYSYFICRHGGSGTNIGGIAQNSSGNGVTFNTSSDYRLKTNEASITDGITRIKQLKPYQFEWKSDLGTKVDGFFAHEVSSIVPEAITGEKDAVETTYYDEEKNLPEGKSIGDAKETDRPVYQSIDQSKLVPLLTAALQEEISKREALETRIAALEG